MFPGQESAAKASCESCPLLVVAGEPLWSEAMVTRHAGQRRRTVFLYSLVLLVPSKHSGHARWVPSTTPSPSCGSGTVSDTLQSLTEEDTKLVNVGFH